MSIFRRPIRPDSIEIKQKVKDFTVEAFHKLKSEINATQYNGTRVYKVGRHVLKISSDKLEISHGFNVKRYVLTSLYKDADNYNLSSVEYVEKFLRENTEI